MSNDPIEREIHLKLAKRLFNRTWELMDKPERTPEQDDEMLAATFASRWHWLQVGEAVHAARGEWQISRVYAVLGLADPCRRHAARCLQIVTANNLSAFDHGAAHEALARAAKVAGDEATRETHVAQMRAWMDRCDDPEDREVLARDLADLGN
ncbi:hypothetical protein K8I61_02395 [bacterium]|nr:hypothetical protein [bacterium]